MGGEVMEKSSVSEGDRMSKSHMKNILINLFHTKVIVHFEFIPQGHTVDQSYYVEISKWVRETVRRKWPEL